MVLATLIPLMSLTAQAVDLPPFPREFRAAWVATVDNIDWPSKRNLSAAQQKSEMLDILNECERLKLNAIVFQVRPAADALYRSKIEPWSEYLTGEQGKAADFDPLEFTVSEAHKRGIEVHCWFNPYRAKHPSAKGPLAKNHIANTHPTSVKSYGKMLWMDPGDPFVQKRSLDVIQDVVKRYDVDGVHIDDYFYPYPEKGVDFPDTVTYKKYGKGLTLDNWRRKNVDTFVEGMYTSVKKIKPWVKVGISPFGIYRPGIPEGIKSGVDQYAQLYADCLKWLQNGWCDYFTPQLYWPISQKAQSFPVLLNWWISVNTQKRHIWPGLYTSRLITGEGGTPYVPEEVENQILLTRTTVGASGHVHFSMKALLKNAQGISDDLETSSYKTEALVPESFWLPKQKLAEPTLKSGEDEFQIRIASKPTHFAVWIKKGGQWDFQVLNGDTKKFARDPGMDVVAVASVDRNGNMSKPSIWTR